MAGKKRIGIYAGSFDPVTLGHIDIIERAARMVDRLIVAIGDNDNKNPLFTVAERISMLESDTRAIKGGAIELTSFRGLLVDFARDNGATVVFRGLRTVSDFAFEFQMTGVNARLAPDIETVFLMSRDKYQFVASSFVREVGRLGGDISSFVTPATVKKLQQKLGVKPKAGKK